MFHVAPSELHWALTKSKPPSVSSFIHHWSSTDPAGPGYIPVMRVAVAVR